MKLNCVAQDQLFHTAAVDENKRKMFFFISYVCLKMISCS